MACAFSSPSLHELRVYRESLLSISQSSNRLHQLNVSECAIAVNEFVIRVTFDTLVEFSDSPREITVLEQRVASIFVLLGDFRVDVSQSIAPVLLFLDSLHGFFSVVVVVLEERGTVQGNGLFQPV